MFEAVSIDPTTVLIKADKESDILSVIDFISQKDKQAGIDSFLQFAANNRTIAKDFKFNRDDCYDG